MHNNNNRIRLPALLLSVGNVQRVFQQNVWTTNCSIFTVKRDLDIYKNDYVAQKSKYTSTNLKWRPNIQHTNQMYIRKFQEKNSKIYRSISQKKTMYRKLFTIHKKKHRTKFYNTIPQKKNQIVKIRDRLYIVYWRLLHIYLFTIKDDFWKF